MGFIAFKEEQIILNLSILLIALSVVYYFLVFLPQKDERSRLAQEAIQEQNQIEKCREAGNDYYQRSTRENPNLSYLNPKFTFNKQLKTCLYSGGFIQGKFLERYIVDLNTNDEIVGYRVDDGNALMGDVCPSCTSIEDFKNKEAELFK